MNTIAKEIAENLEFYAQYLAEHSDEHPEYADANGAAIKELGELETLFRKDETDSSLLLEFKAVVGDPDQSFEYQAYERTLADVGFNSHYETAEDFLKAVIAAAKPTRSYPTRESTMPTLNENLRSLIDGAAGTILRAEMFNADEALKRLKDEDLRILMLVADGISCWANERIQGEKPLVVPTQKPRRGRERWAYYNS